MGTRTGGADTIRDFDRVTGHPTIRHHVRRDHRHRDGVRRIRREAGHRIVRREEGRQWCNLCRANLEKDDRQRAGSRRRGGRPPGTVKPTPLPQPGKPGGPSIQPVKPGGPSTLPAKPVVQPKPTTRPGTPTRPSAPQNTRELRGYPPAQNVKPVARPNAFSGTTGGRPESARGNRSLNPPAKPQSAPARAPSPAPRAPSGGKKQ